MRIAVYSSARSDFGLLRPFLMQASRFSDVHVIAGGAHFSASKGLTIHEIEEFAKTNAIQVIPAEFLVEGSRPEAQAKSIAIGQATMTQIFSVNHYDALVLLGDRWELFAASIPALVQGIPIAHISGGEITEGVIDDSVRHAHSKMAHLHFVASEAFADNLSRMGEEDWRITISGECGLDSIHNGEFASRDEVRERFGIDLDHPTLLITYHPATLEHALPFDQQAAGLIEALQTVDDLTIVITAPGMEQGSDIIQSQLKAFASTRPNVHFVPHLGSRCYLAVLRFAQAVVGNSSSGLVEAASFGVPAVDIGSRQAGRLAAPSVLRAGYDADSILTALQTALSPSFQAHSKSVSNPYDPYKDGRNSERIAHGLAYALRHIPRDRLCAKKFAMAPSRTERNALLKDFR